MVVGQTTQSKVLLCLCTGGFIFKDSICFEIHALKAYEEWLYSAASLLQGTA